MTIEPYYACCTQCDKKLWDMISEPPSTHVVLESTFNRVTHIQQDHARFCGLKCLHKWIEVQLDWNQ